MNFVCLPQIDDNDPMIKACVDQVKMKLNFVPETCSPDGKNVPENSIRSSLKELSQLVPEKNKERMKYDSKFGRVNGSKPKFVRARELHKYLFYLTRDYSGQLTNSEELVKNMKKQGIQIDAETQKNLDSVEIFHKNLSWKTFIPGLPQHTGWTKGWVLMCDALLRIPLRYVS